MKPASSARVPIVYRTVSLPGKRDPVALLHLLLRHGRWSDYFFYEGEGKARFALGAWARVVLHGDALHFFAGEEMTREAVGDPLKQTERLLARLPVQDWTAYGYVAFDVAGYYGPYAKRIAEPTLFFLIPETEVFLEDQGVTIRTIGDGEEVRHLLEMGGQSPVPPYEPAQVTLENLDRDGYTARVRALVQQMKEGRLQKAIIARSVLVPGPLSSGNLHRRSGGE